MSTLQLEEFMDSHHAPPYAILSHTWEEGEVTFQDFASPDVAKLKRGFGKIERTCKLAEANGIGYAWVDTCCIDKTSSAELTEAINSMFQWYARSQVCYAWLADLKAGEPIRVKDFASCRWFKRGWTLQELIAPGRVEFYDEAWTFRGTKAELGDELESATGIDGHVLRAGTIGVLSAIPLARRMSWASDRVTTRREDAAYCLLGIFGVNMPLLYGEGEKAFIRLQEEIIKQSNDLSLFAWTLPSDTEAALRDLGLSAAGTSQAAQAYHGVLATSPACFKEAGDIVSGDDGLFDETYVMTNKGLQIADDAVLLDDTLALPLHCTKGVAGRQVAICLRQHGTRLYARSRPDTLVLCTELADASQDWQRPSGAVNSATVSSVFLSKTLTAEQASGIARSRRDGIVLGPSFFGPDWRLRGLGPDGLYDNSRRLFLTRGRSSFAGYALPLPVVDVRDHFNPLMYVVFGLENGEGWVTVLHAEDQPDLVSWIRNPRTLATNARGHIHDHVIVRNALRTKKMRVSVHMRKTELEGEPVYVVNVNRGDIEHQDT